MMSSSNEMRLRHYQYCRVHSIEYYTVIDARWVSVTDDDVDGDFLVLELPPLLRGIIDICSLVGTPNLRLEGFGGRGRQICLWAYNPSVWAFHPSMWARKRDDGQ